MLLSLAAALGLLAHVATPDPIRVWRADSTVYVSLRDPGYLAVLRVDPVGRIQVLFPFSPEAPAAVPGGATFEVLVPADRDEGTGTIVAVRSRQPLRFAGLSAGSAWDYEHALLLQPTAGDPLAALFDIADRITGGQAYEFDVATYRVGKALAARDPQLATPVCLGCVPRGRPEPPAVTIVQSNSVDCSNAVLVNSFCGVANGSVAITTVHETVYQPTPPAPVYVPYFEPLFVPQRRRRAPSPPPPPPTRNLAIPLRVARGVTPPPTRHPIHVQEPRQPYAPSRPWQPPPPPPPSLPVPDAVGGRVMTAVATPPPASRPAGPAASAPEPRTQAVPERRAGSAAGSTAPRVLVPSRALLRTITSRRP